MATYFDRITGLAEQEWQAANACTDVTKKDEYLFRAAKYGHIDALFAFAAECVGTRAAQVSEKELKNIYKKISKFSDKLKKAKSSEDAFAIADKCLSWDDKAAPRYQYILGKKVAQFGKFSLTILNAATAGDPEAMLAVQEQASTNDNIADFYTGRILYAGKFDWEQMLKYAFCGMGFDYSPYYPKGFADIPGMPGGVDISSIRANAYEQLLKTLEFFAVPAKQGAEEYKARFGDFVPDEDTVMIARYWFYTKDARLTENNEITAYKEKVVAEIDKAISSAMEAEDKKKAAETPKPQATDAGKTIMVKDVFESGASYEGEALNGKRHGKGIYRFTDGRIYEGDFVANERTGKGKMTWANGDVYEGDFIDGDRTGKGDYRWPNGDRYIGDFVNDRMMGCGTYYYANGDRYEGGFLDDKRHGKGKYTYADGRCFIGEWDADKRIIKSETTDTDEEFWEKFDDPEELRAKWEKPTLFLDSRDALMINSSQYFDQFYSRINDCCQESDFEAANEILGALVGLTAQELFDYYNETCIRIWGKIQLLSPSFGSATLIDNAVDAALSRAHSINIAGVMNIAFYKYKEIGRSDMLEDALRVYIPAGHKGSNTAEDGMASLWFRRHIVNDGDVDKSISGFSLDHSPYEMWGADLDNALNSGNAMLSTGYIGPNPTIRDDDEDYANEYVEDKTIRYSDGTEAYGEGKTIRYSDGTYVGMVKNGKPHGYGEMTFSNGDFYGGWWANGKKHGIGWYVFDGAIKIYCGLYKNGKRCGMGVEFSDSNPIEGYWDGQYCRNPWDYTLENYILSKGSLDDTYAEILFAYGPGDFAMYIGGLKNRMYHGIGTYYTSDGYSFKCKWTENEVDEILEVRDTAGDLLYGVDEFYCEVLPR